MFTETAHVATRQTAHVATNILHCRFVANAANRKICKDIFWSTVNDNSESSIPVALPVL